MHNLIVSSLPPNMDSFAPEFCFCGKRTVESHEFWFCSTDCARLDSLRSLDDPECHYRAVVRKAYVRAGVPEPYPRRMMSADHLRPGPSGHRALAKLPSRFRLPTNSPHRTLARGEIQSNMAECPTRPQVTGQIYTNVARGGWPLVTPKQDRPKWEDLPNARSRAGPAASPGDRTLQQISLDVVPLPEPDPAHSLGRPTEAGDGLRNSIRRSVAALRNIGKSWRGRDSNNAERVFGHPANVIVPPVREESLPSHRQKGLSAIPAQRSKALRRSVSLGGWDTTQHTDPSDAYDAITRIIEDMCEEVSKGEGIDPKLSFGQRKDY